MLRVVDLKPGDEILGWMKNGFGLRKGRNAATGQVFRYVPGKASRFEGEDLSRFTGFLTKNDVANKILVVEVQEMNRYAMAVSPPIRAEIPYLALIRLRRVSKIAFPGKPQNPKRPTQIAIGTENRPYRTIEEVLLKWS
jgi:hypothetical protein